MKFRSYDIGKISFLASAEPEPLFIYITGHGYLSINLEETLISKLDKDKL